MDKMLVWSPKEAISNFVSRQIGLNLPWGDHTVLGYVDDGMLVAGIVYNHYIPGISICMNVGSSKQRWLTPEFLFAVFDYPFRTLELKRVTAFVSEGNHSSRRFVEHVGFVQEGRMRSAAPEGGDLFVYGMLREECKWISDDFAKRVWKRLQMRSIPSIYDGSVPLH